jgi:hypothetical protein
MDHTLFELLKELDSAAIHYTLARYVPDSVCITLTLVGERVEVYVFDDGRLEFSRYKGHEDVCTDKAALKQLIDENRD